MSREAAEGFLDFSAPKKLEYRFSSEPLFSPPASVVIEYRFNVLPDSADKIPTPVFEIGGAAWALPLPAGGETLHYAIPVDDTFSGYFSVSLKDGADKQQAKKKESPRLQLRSIEFRDRWYGWDRHKDESGEHVFISPFVDIRRGENGVSLRLFDSWESFSAAPVDVPAGFFPALTAVLGTGKEAALEAGNLRFEALSGAEIIHIPAGMIDSGTRPFIFSGDRAATLRLGYAKLPLFPAPLAADPGMVISWPVEHWRDRRYEVFRWEKFPSLLIFDTADYEVQDRLFKRLAFFVEKAGFRGRLAPDAEIAGLHGWNAHDYRADDLARFFQAARQADFSLLAEERELERILFNAGIIRAVGSGIQAGEGGIISISRESEDYLRGRFLSHEGFHGLFFIDNDFQDFCRGRWQLLDREAKRFIVSYFNYQRYDTADEYLLINEFMAHILQQPVSQAGHYFGSVLPSRLEDSWRKADLPDKDEASGSWPILAAVFTEEARAFSAYVDKRWGLAAGRVNMVSVRQL